MAERCGQPTKKGTPCKNRPMHDRDVCKQHTGDENVGQRKKLTKELIGEISTFIQRGLPVKLACQAVGCSESAFYHWREVGEADIEQEKATLYSEFVESTTRARAECIAAHALNVQKHAMGYRNQNNEYIEGDARLSQWFLERRGGDDWREKKEIEHSGSIARPNADAIPDDEDRLNEVSSTLAEIGALPQNGGDA